jgi:excisionase family DNA binding protein
MSRTQGLVSLKIAAEILGCGTSTLRTWDNEGSLKAVRTPGGQRRYRIEDLEKFQGIIKKTTPKSDAVAAYCRVSSHEQKAKGDLERQKGRVLTHCVGKKYNVTHVLEEVGSGMTDTRVKMLKLFDLAIKGEISRVVVEHKDRLARFNFNIFQKFFESHGVTVEWIDDVLPKSYEAELVEDMVSLMASFSAKVYGKRSAENRKRKKAEKAAVAP